jgi:hypothetical protein
MDLLQTSLVYLREPYLVINMVQELCLNQEQGIWDMARVVIGAITGGKVIF